MVVRSFSAEDSSKHLSSEGKLAAAQPLHSAALDRVSAFAACSRPSGSQPHIHHATASRVVKGEDVLFVHPLSIPTQPPCMMYMVCDGHSGVEAANFVASNFLRVLNTKLPQKLPNFGNAKEVETFAENIRKALCETFVRLDNEWANVGHLSGTTVSVALCTGWLLTVANTGDSAVVLDTGCSLLELTLSHRIQSNMDEQARLKAAGQQLAPLGFHLQGPAKPGEPGVGPMRLWPGGLCVSRSIGDLDAGAEVVPVPHIRQVILPVEGCRVVMASDGLWDVLTFTKALKLTRSKPTGAAASTLVTAVSRDLRTMDDASIIIIDMLPSEGTSFPTVALKANPKGTEKSSSGFFACFKPEVEEPDSRESAGKGHLGYFCDVDCLRAYPGLKQLLVRTTLAMPNGGHIPTPPAQRGPVDYTLHGAKAYMPNGIPRVPSAMGLDTSQPGSMEDRTHHSIASASGVVTRGMSGGLYAAHLMNSSDAGMVVSRSHDRSPTQGSTSEAGLITEFGSAPATTGGPRLG